MKLREGNCNTDHLPHLEVELLAWLTGPVVERWDKKVRERSRSTIRDVTIGQAVPKEQGDGNRYLCRCKHVFRPFEAAPKIRTIGTRLIGTPR
eukprot:3940728-Rhodomonas_salina.5